MESKIEKLERVKPMALMGMMGEVAPQWVAKELNRIIDHLNSQAQPEENEEWRKKWEDLFSLEYGYSTWGEMPIYKEELLDLIQQLLEDREREAKIEVLTEIFQTCYQEDSRTLELVQEKLQDLKDLSLVLS